MADTEVARKLPVVKIFEESFFYIKQNIKTMVIFMLVNVAFLALGFGLIGGWSNPLFLLWCLAYYVFWTFFFRFYFDRKPYFLSFRKMADSFVPSTKILLIAFAVGTLLTFLPFVPLFVLPLEQVEQYERFLKNYMQDSTLFDLVLNIVVLVFSPVIFFRPFMAWISAIIGRSGSIRTAFAKTENNHWRMVGAAFLINVPFLIIAQLEFMYHIPNLITWTLASPFVIFANIVVAESYEFFYLEN